MENRDLDAFLAQQSEGERAAPEHAPEPGKAEPRPTTDQPGPAPQPDGKDMPAPDKPPKAAEAEAATEEAEPETQPDGAVPRSAFDAVRHERRDWKSKAVKAETEAAELRKQLEEAKRITAAPPAPAAPPAAQFQFPELPDFNTDPRGYVEALSARHTFDLLNQKLNESEERMRDKIGDDKVEQYKEEFMKLAAADQSLQQKAFAARNPYAFVVKEVDKVRHFREVGDDPAAFQEKLREKLRAEWEAEQAAKQQQPASPPASPVADMQPSLARARSAAPRAAPAWSGEISDEELVRGIQGRKRNNNHHAS